VTWSFYIAAARSSPGSKRHGNQDDFFVPTVVIEVPDDSKIMADEPFGPVVPIRHLQNLR
jgi:succinate-semialdehyde dehydrogenase/glutarate-semialdehyde dehydrogenase